MGKIKVAVIFGGQSGEHEISIISARSIFTAINKKKYHPIPIAISQKGEWLDPKYSLKFLQKKHITKISKQQTTTVEALKKVDIVFPVLHGPFGEDGTIQGLIEMLNIAYVGSGVIGSALAMDKAISKKVFSQNKFPTLPYLEFVKSRTSITNIQTQISNIIGYPCFVKPANLGSSVGISKIKKSEDLKKALNLAFAYDQKIVIEKGLRHAREIECAVLGNLEPQVSVLGEIIPSGEFYDYNAKYINNKSKLIIPANLPIEISKKICNISVQAFRALDCSGLARVDFLVQKKTNKIYLNELNTIPGFTSISMYPKLWHASGINYPRLIDKLIQLGFERSKQKKGLKTTYE